IHFHTQDPEYNIPGGKLNQAMSVVDIAGIFEASSCTLNDKEYLQVAVLSWGVESVCSLLILS
ncbi:hypothetical protein K435DRAFT_562428, partial [Dendrothele bispora CBS 962.96]